MQDALSLTDFLGLHARIIIVTVHGPREKGLFTH